MLLTKLRHLRPLLHDFHEGHVGEAESTVLLPSFAVMQASQDQPRHTHRADCIHVETEGAIPSEGTILYWILFKHFF